MKLLAFISNQRRIYQIFVIGIIVISSTVFLLQLQSLTPNERGTKAKKFAYVFYITEPEYACYAGVNADRLIDDLSIDLQNIDVVFFYTSADWRLKKALQSCSRQEVKLLKINDAPRHAANHEDNYAQSYVRFEALRLTQYQRIVILDADGLIIRNMDNLFTIPLRGQPVAGVLADYLPHQWLSSILLVVEPSFQLYDRIMQYLTPEGIKQVSAYANGSHYDMDILNYALRSGRDIRLIPSGYAVLDSDFLDKNRDNMDGVHYVHFSARKPLIYMETRRRKDKMNRQAQWIYETFWKGFAKRCANILENSVAMALEHAEMIDKESELDKAIISEFNNHPKKR